MVPFVPRIALQFLHITTWRKDNNGEGNTNNAKQTRTTNKTTSYTNNCNSTRYTHFYNTRSVGHKSSVASPASQAHVIFMDRKNIVR